jgi:hypothetical protein
MSWGVRVVGDVMGTNSWCFKWVIVGFGECSGQAKRGR